MSARPTFELNPAAAAAHDVLIRGSGPVGACLALALAHQGLKAALLGTAAAAASAATLATTSARPDLRAYALNAASVELHELTGERADLEQVFLQLTAGKADIR